ncbi:MAG TPA: autotransporter outer membrane beta-barrel domain-containing protein [Devosiaceae bacterium]|jgi:fibronectin-binding autotransporter adhesin
MHDISLAWRSAHKPAPVAARLSRLLMLGVAIPAALAAPAMALGADTTVPGGITKSVTSQGDLGGTGDTTTVQPGGTLAISGDIVVEQGLYTLSGNGNGGIGALNSTGNNTVSGPIDFGASTTITSASGTLTLDGPISSGVPLDLDLTLGGDGNFLYSGDMNLGGIGQSYAFHKVGNGTLALDGGNSSYTGVLSIDGGTLEVSGGGEFTVNSSYLPNGPVDDATFVNANLLVTGAGSTFTNTSDLIAGRDTTGAVTIGVDNQGKLVTQRAFLGEGILGAHASAISATVDGAGSVWEVGEGGLFLAAAMNGIATLTVSNGGALTSTDGSFTIGFGGDGDLLVTGAGSTVSTDWYLKIGEMRDGNSANGTLVVEDGAIAKASQVDIGVGSDGIVTVTGGGSQLQAGAFLGIGEGGGTTAGPNHIGHGEVTIEDGGLATANNVWIGIDNGVVSGSSGELTVLGTPGHEGVLETSSLMKGNDSATALFDGGILRATADTVDNGYGNPFLGSYSGTFTIGIGPRGMTIDTQGFDTLEDANVVLANGQPPLPGSLIKQGTGRLVMAGDNTYIGGTTIAAGILQLGNGGTTGSILGNVADAGTLAFNRSNTYTFDGIVSGAGDLHQDGTGTTVLRATNTYTGGTTITAGTLQLGDGGNSGSIVGNVADEGTLAFNRNNAYTFSGIVSGTGALRQIGTGTTILTAANTYTGGTTITDGTLQLGDGTTTGSIMGNVADNGTLAFNRSDAVVFGGVVSGTGELRQIGTGTTALTGASTYTGGTTITDGTLQLGNGGNTGSIVGNVANAGTLAFNRSNTYAFSGAVSGAGGLSQIGAGTTILSGANTYVGDTHVMAGTLQAGATNSFSAASNAVVDAGGAMNLAGFNQTIASLRNAGLVSTNGTGPGTVLTVTNNYTATGGIVALNTALGDDSSATDLLHIQGSSSGTGLLRVTNLNGKGAQTVEGIKVVSIDGASNAAFTLDGVYRFHGDPAVVGGAYSYRLYKGSVSVPTDGDWYLRSLLTDPVVPPGGPTGPSGPLYQPGAPIYEAFANVLQGFNGLDTMQRRLGNRAWTDGVVDTGTTPDGMGEGSGLWGRIIGGHMKIDPRTSTTNANYDTDTWQLQAGADGLLHTDDKGRLNGGIFVDYGTVSADVHSPYGVGSIGASGYGLGGTLTWQGHGGFYLDAQARLTWYDSDLHSATAATSLASGIKGFGYAASLEAGQRIALGPNWTLTPQAQLVYSAVDYDDFTDTFGASVALDDGARLRGRLGISADYENSWTEDGDTRQLHAYGIANLYYDFTSGSKTNLAGVTLTSQEDPLWGGLGIGGTYNWGDDKYAIHGEALVNTSLSNFGNSYDLTGTLGFNVKF